MNRFWPRILLAVFLSSWLLGSGCSLRETKTKFDLKSHRFEDLDIAADYPDANRVIETSAHFVEPPADPEQESQRWDVSVDHVIQLALKNSTILRDLGGAVVRSPENARTIHEPAIQATDPRFGVEAALSAFDAQFDSFVAVEKNDRVFNNLLAGGGANEIQQDLTIFQAGISKKSATGTEFSVRHNIDYDSNNAPGNRFFSAWNTNYEVEARHPLLQGGGTEFNRIAGPTATPGVLNGVLIARLDADKSVADFEIGIRDLVNNVENAYWDLYFSYRNFDAKVAARDAALSTWRKVQANDASDKEPQAREQYFRLEEEVHNALSGRTVEGTRSNNGSTGGTFRGTLGIHVAERRLRLLMGIPINDGKILCPERDPTPVKVLFDWSQIVQEALARRVELRKQSLQVRRCELELLASRNFLLPEVDVFSRYRWRGFGDDLIAARRAGRDQFDNAYMDLTSGDFQEWQLGLEVKMPFGFRQAHSAVRHAQLRVARERAVMQEQERQIIHDLSNAFSDLQRSYKICEVTFNRLEAARTLLTQLNERYENPVGVEFDQLLNAQRGLADAQAKYFRALVEYSLAVKNVHFEKGSLLEYSDVYLAERVQLCR